MTMDEENGEAVSRTFDQKLLKSGIVVVTGGIDRCGRIIVTLPAEVLDVLYTQYSTAHLVLLIQSYLHLVTPARWRKGLAFLMDLYAASRETITIIIDALDRIQTENSGCVGMLYAIMPKTKDLCRFTKKSLGIKASKKHPKVPLYESTLFMDRTELFRYIMPSQLVSSFSGTFRYNHDTWVIFLKKVDDLKETIKAVINKAPVAQDKVRMLSEYEVPLKADAINTVLAQVRAKYNDIMRELNVEPVIDECGTLLQQMANAESHPAYSYICHTPTFLDAKTAIEIHRKHLIEVREHLKLLWQLAESRVVGVSKVSKYQEKAGKVMQWITDVGIPTVNHDPEIADCLSQAEIFRLHFETGFYGIAQNVIELAEKIEKKLSVVLEETKDKGGKKGESQQLINFKQQFHDKVAGFRQMVAKKHQVYVNVHNFFTNAVKVVEWYRQALHFLPVQLLQNPCFSGSKRAAASYISDAWTVAVENFLMRHAAPSRVQLSKVKNVIPVIDDVTVRNQARLLIHRVNQLRKLLLTPETLTLPELRDLLNWKDALQHGTDDIYGLLAVQPSGTHSQMQTTPTLLSEVQSPGNLAPKPTITHDVQLNDSIAHNGQIYPSMKHLAVSPIGRIDDMYINSSTSSDDINQYTSTPRQVNGVRQHGTMQPPGIRSHLREGHSKQSEPQPTLARTPKLRRHEGRAVTWANTPSEEAIHDLRVRPQSTPLPSTHRHHLHLLVDDLSGSFLPPGSHSRQQLFREDESDLGSHIIDGQRTGTNFEGPLLEGFHGHLDGSFHASHIGHLEQAMYTGGHLVSDNINYSPPHSPQLAHSPRGVYKYRFAKKSQRVNAGPVTDSLSPSSTESQVRQTPVRHEPKHPTRATQTGSSLSSSSALSPESNQASDEPRVVALTSHQRHRTKSRPTQTGSNNARNAHQVSSSSAQSSGKALPSGVPSNAGVKARHHIPSHHKSPDTHKSPDMHKPNAAAPRAKNTTANMPTSQREHYISLDHQETPDIPPSLKHVDIAALKQNMPQDRHSGPVTAPEVTSNGSLGDSGFAGTQGSASTNDGTNNTLPQIQSQDQSGEQEESVVQQILCSAGQIKESSKHDGKMAMIQRNIDAIVSSNMSPEEKLNIMAAMCESGQHVADMTVEPVVEKPSIQDDHTQTTPTPSLQHYITTAATPAKTRHPPSATKHRQPSSLMNSPVYTKSPAVKSTSESHHKRSDQSQKMTKHPADPKSEDISEAKSQTHPFTSRSPRQRDHLSSQMLVTDTTISDTVTIPGTTAESIITSVFKTPPDGSVSLQEWQHSEDQKTHRDRSLALPAGTSNRLDLDDLCDDDLSELAGVESHGITGVKDPRKHYGIDIEEWMRRQEESSIGTSDTLDMEHSLIPVNARTMQYSVHKLRQARQVRKSEEAELEKAHRELRELMVAEEELAQDDVERSLRRTQRVLQEGDGESQGFHGEDDNQWFDWQVEPVVKIACIKRSNDEQEELLRKEQAVHLHALSPGGYTTTDSSVFLYDNGPSRSEYTVATVPSRQMSESDPESTLHDLSQGTDSIYNAKLAEWHRHDLDIQSRARTSLGSEIHVCSSPVEPHEISRGTDSLYNAQLGRSLEHHPSEHQGEYGDALHNIPGKDTEIKRIITPRAVSPTNQAGENSTDIIQETLMKSDEAQPLKSSPKSLVSSWPVAEDQMKTSEKRPSKVPTAIPNDNISDESGVFTHASQDSRLKFINDLQNHLPPASTSQGYAESSASPVLLGHPKPKDTNVSQRDFRDVLRKRAEQIKERSETMDHGPTKVKYPEHEEMVNDQHDSSHSETQFKRNTQSISRTISDAYRRMLLKSKMEKLRRSSSSEMSSSPVKDGKTLMGISATQQISAEKTLSKNSPKEPEMPTSLREYKSKSRPQLVESASLDVDLSDSSCDLDELVKCNVDEKMDTSEKVAVTDGQVLKQQPSADVSHGGRKQDDMAADSEVADHDSASYRTCPSSRDTSRQTSLGKGFGQHSRSPVLGGRVVRIPQITIDGNDLENSMLALCVTATDPGNSEVNSDGQITEASLKHGGNVKHPRQDTAAAPCSRLSDDDSVSTKSSISGNSGTLYKAKFIDLSRSGQPQSSSRGSRMHDGVSSGSRSSGASVETNNTGTSEADPSPSSTQPHSHKHLARSSCLDMADSDGLVLACSDKDEIPDDRSSPLFTDRRDGIFKMESPLSSAVDEEKISKVTSPVTSDMSIHLDSSEVSSIEGESRPARGPIIPEVVIDSATSAATSEAETSECTTDDETSGSLSSFATENAENITKSKLAAITSTPGQNKSAKAAADNLAAKYSDNDSALKVSSTKSSQDVTDKKSGAGNGDKNLDKDSSGNGLEATSDDESTTESTLSESSEESTITDASESDSESDSKPLMVTGASKAGTLNVVKPINSSEREPANPLVHSVSVGDGEMLGMQALQRRMELVQAVYNKTPAWSSVQSSETSAPLADVSTPPVAESQAIGVQVLERRMEAAKALLLKNQSRQMSTRSEVMVDDHPGVKVNGEGHASVGGGTSPSSFSDSLTFELLNLKTPVIIDNGSGFCKCGFAGDDAPQSVFPAFVGHAKYEEVMVQGGQQTEYVGEMAQSLRGMLKLQYPLSHGIITDWDNMTKIWDHALYDQLRISPEEHPVLLTEAPLNPRSNRERMAQVMFEDFGVPALYVAVQAVLALYSAGRTTGVVLDSGDGVTHVIPVYEGYSLTHCTQRLDLAGRDLTHYLVRLLQEQGTTLHSSAEYQIAREIKEKLCYVSSDLHADLAQAETSASANEFYTMPDGEVIAVGTERFRCPEVLFDPSLIGRDHPGIHQCLYNSIAKCDLDLRTELLRNIVLSGGTTLLPGLAKRLQSEINALCPPGGSSTVNIVDSDEQHHLVWRGGSILASLPGFDARWVLRSEYEEFGATIIHQKCFT